jgi:hypothetical protein
LDVEARHPNGSGAVLLFRLRARRAAMCRLLGTPRSHRPTHHAPATLLLLLGALAFATPALAYPGRWTPTTTLSGTAVHLSLLRGDGNPYFARVVWWQGDDRVGNVVGGQWGWKPGLYGCSVWPDTQFTEIDLPDAPGGSIFCSGNTSMADGGKLFVPGGTVGAEDGVRDVRIFTPSGNGSGDSWTADSSMGERRW